MFRGLNLLDLKPADWEKLAHGDLLTGRGACGKAEEFASLNGATAICEASIPVITVKVKTNETVGESVVPGTQGLHGGATAKALIKPRCSLRSAPVPAPPTPTPSPTSSPTPSPGATGVAFVCDGKQLTLDPAKPGPLAELARALFTVRLVD